MRDTIYFTVPIIGGENTEFNDITKKSDSDLFYPRSFVGFGIRYFLPH